MAPHRSFPNSIVKGYSGEDTKGVALWENNTMSKSKIVKKLCNLNYTVNLVWVLNK